MCKFWDLVFEENVKKRKIQKAQFWARLEYTCKSHVKISNSNSKKPRRKSHFSIWAQTLGAGWSGIYRKMRGLTDRTVVHVLYSILHCSVAAAGWLACHAVLFFCVCVWCKCFCKRLCVGSILIPPQEKTVSSPFSPYSKTYIKCGRYTLFW